MKEAIVLAGGFGTRLQSVVNDVPKPMAPVAGKPFLNYILDYLVKNKIQSVVLSVGYLSEKIKDYFGDHYNGLEIIYAKEEVPLGTGGAIQYALSFCQTEDVLILNGDSFFDCNLIDQYKFHLDNNALITFGLKEMKNIKRYGSVEIDTNNRITAFNEKKEIAIGLINTGVYIMNKRIFESVTLPSKFSLEEDFFKVQADKLPFFGFKNDGFFIDIGIPEDFDHAQHVFSKF